jgi:hypothetical protein
LGDLLWVEVEDFVDDGLFFEDEAEEFSLGLFLDDDEEGFPGDSKVLFLDEEEDFTVVELEVFLIVEDLAEFGCFFSD